MKKILKKVLDVVMFVLGFGGTIRDECVDAGICDFSGQGRDKYGK